MEESRRKIPIRYVGPKGILPLKMEAYFQCWWAGQEGIWHSGQKNTASMEMATSIKKQWVEGSISILVAKNESEEIEARFSGKFVSNEGDLQILKGENHG